MKNDIALTVIAIVLAYFVVKLSWVEIANHFDLQED